MIYINAGQVKIKLNLQLKLLNDLQPHNHNLIPTRCFVISTITVSNLKLIILYDIQTIHCIS